MTLAVELYTTWSFLLEGHPIKSKGASIIYPPYTSHPQGLAEERRGKCL